MTSVDRQGLGRRALLVALVALALIAPAAAQARPPKTFYGVTPQAQLGAYELERMGLGRVGTLRVSFSWGAVDDTPVPGDIDWTLYDQIVGSAAQVGIQVLPVFDNTADWVAELDSCQAECTRFAPRGELALLAWRGFLRSAVLRYGPTGSYWAEHPEVQAKPIRAWQIWNEQNSAQYFKPAPDVDVYARLVTEASRAIKEQDPEARVILGGMFATPSGQLDENASWRYLKRLYSKPGLKERFEGVGIHPYAGSMKNLRQTVQLVRGAMKGAGDSRTGLWVTEVGWSSRKGDYYLEVGERRQAALLRKSFRYFTRQRKPMHIKTVNWFSWRDTPRDFALCIWCPDSGLFTREGFQPKPAWRVFRRFTGGH
jgi:polysaccharide biosynthesis protein PslG